MCEARRLTDLRGASWRAFFSMVRRPLTRLGSTPRCPEHRLVVDHPGSARSASASCAVRSHWRGLRVSRTAPSIAASSAGRAGRCGRSPRGAGPRRRRSVGRRAEVTRHGDAACAGARRRRSRRGCRAERGGSEGGPIRSRLRCSAAWRWLGRPPGGSRSPPRRRRPAVTVSRKGRMSPPSRGSAHHRFGPATEGPPGSEERRTSR